MIWEAIMNQLINVRLFRSETRTSKTVTVVERCVEKEYALHSHDFYELELVVGGRGRQWINNVRVRAGAHAYGGH
jgi:hypothetical protein